MTLDALVNEYLEWQFDEGTDGGLLPWRRRSRRPPARPVRRGLRASGGSGGRLGRAIPRARRRRADSGRASRPRPRVEQPARLRHHTRLATMARDPDPYVSAGLMGVFSLFVRRLHPEDELVRGRRPTRPGGAGARTGSGESRSRAGEPSARAPGTRAMPRRGRLLPRPAPTRGRRRCAAGVGGRGGRQGRCGLRIVRFIPR